MDYAQLATMVSGLFHGGLLPNVMYILTYVAPVVLAFCLGAIFWHVWVRYVQIKQFLGLKYTVLELKLPKDTFKSPLSMETVLHSINNNSDGSLYLQYWKGETRPWYSLEIIGIEGQVKFLIWTEDRRKNNLSSALYAQYPGIEIREIDDYARAVQWDPKELKIWASEFKFEKPDPYPIKTYIDYGLDKDPKEEFKVDPLTHMLEWLGSLRPNEQAWFQFMVRAHKKDQKHPEFFWKRTDLWADEAKKIVNELLVRDPKTKTAGGEPDPESGYTKLPIISQGERDIIEAIERKQTKLPFDVCVRALYIAKRDVFDTPFGIGGCISSMRQFNSNSLNGFKPGGYMMPGSLDYDWEDYRNFRRNRYSERVLMAYRRRSAFYHPYKAKTMVLNTEELATIYHFPGSVAATPNLERVPSKKGTAPTNLPI